jgi:hypothetical protein
MGAPRPVQKPAVQPTHSYDFNQSGSLNVRNTSRITADPQEKQCVSKWDFNRPVSGIIQSTIRPQPYEDDCIIKWDFNQSSGTTVVNAVHPGTYDLSVPTGTYTTLNSGAFALLDATDSTWHATTDGAFNRNSKKTYEFFYYSGDVAAARVYLYAKGSDYICVEPTGSIRVKRMAAGGGSGYWSYVTPAGTIVSPSAVGSEYHIVVAWDMRRADAAHAPIIYVNGESQTVTLAATGGSHWDANTSSPYIFSIGGGAHVATDQAMLSCRIYSSVLSADRAYTNFIAENWRICGLANSGGVATADIDSYYYRFTSTNFAASNAGMSRIGGMNGLEPFSVEWVGKVTADTGGNQYLAGTVIPGGTGWLLYWDFAASTLRFTSFGVGWATNYEISSSVVAFGRVYHVVVTYDPYSTDTNNLKLYINGALNTQVHASIAIYPFPPLPLRFGNDVTPSAFNVYLARIYKNAILSLDDVKQNYVAESWRYAGLTNTGAVSTPGVNSYYYNFDGADYLAAASPAVLPDAFSIEFQVSCTIDAGWRGPIGDYGTSPSANGWTIVRHPTILYYYFTVYNAGVGVLTLTTTKTDFVSGQVYHFVLTYDKNGGANNIKWYIDGVLDKQATVGALAIPTDASALQIGRYSISGGNWLGGIYLARLYDIVLSAAEAAKSYLSEKWRSTITKTDEYVEIAPPVYRVWARNYDYTLRNPVTTWLTMDVQLKYCDVSTVVMTMNTADFLAGWFDSVYTPQTEGTWIQNRIARSTDIAPFLYPARRFLKGTGLVIWRNADETPAFSGVISGFKEHRVVGGEDTCEVTFSSDELLLEEHIAFPDWETISGTGYSGHALPSPSGIWGPSNDGGKGGDQWGTESNELEDPQEAQMKYFVQDQIGVFAAATSVTNRKLSVLKTQAVWNYSSPSKLEGYGDKTLLTDILDTLLDLCKYCVVPQPAVGSPAEALVPSPQEEIQFFIRYLYPPDGTYYLEFRTQTATNAAQRLAMPPRFTDGGNAPDGYHADYDMGEHDKRLTCVFSELTGTVTEVTYEELRPEVNQCFVIGPTPNADTYVANYSSHDFLDDGSDLSSYCASVDNSGSNTITPVQDTTTSIDHRIYKLVTGKPVVTSQDIYGVVEGTHEHSTGEATSKSRTLNMMQYSGRAMLNEKLVNKYFEATITENKILTLSPDDGPQNFWIGDYVKVITKNGTLENLVRSVDLSIDSNGEVMKCVVGSAAAAYGNWWTANVKAKEIHHQHRRSRNAHYHRTRS